MLVDGPSDHEQRNIRLGNALDARCKTLVAELGLDTGGGVQRVVPLTGGVASDIARVDLGSRAICVKFALSKLKVIEDWRAPVHRNRAEYAWLKVAANVAPASAVALFGRSESQHGFAMEFIAGDDVRLWKDDLLDGQNDLARPGKVGDLLGRIHAASVKPDFDQSHFHNRDDFKALRIDPYLTFTAARHAAVADELNTLAEMLYESETALVHGDVSPKNILFRNGKPVILDAECATMGDPAFDLAFCVNHLALKSLHVPALSGSFGQASGDLWAAYAPHVTWEPPADIEARTCRLLPALMLARVDGKSPVEYLNEHEQDNVRSLALDLIGRAPTSLASFTAALKE